MILRHSFALLVLTAVFRQAPAQTPAPAELIDQLVANAEQYRATLPSLTADETISSVVSYRGILPDKVQATATLRAIRPAPGEQIQESRQYLTINGKPFDPAKKSNPPYTLFGGFGGFQEMFFTAGHKRCFLFTLLPDQGTGGSIQIAIAARPDMAGMPGCDVTRSGLTGLIRLDPQTHHIVHLERTIPDDQTEHTNLAAFASVDLAPTRVGDDTFWLPTTVIGRSPKRAIRGECIMHYSNYHRYTASMKLLPGATEVDPPTPTPPPTSTPP